jgi:hypothetical protein
MQVSCAKNNHMKNICLVDFKSPFFHFLHFYLHTKIFMHNYVCMWKIITTTWIILYWTIQFFPFKLVSCECYLQFLKISFFGTPTMNGPSIWKLERILTLMIRRAKGFELVKIVFLTNLNTFGSKVFLTLKSMDFENVPLTKVVHVYVIKGIQCIIIQI